MNNESGLNMMPQTNHPSPEDLAGYAMKALGPEETRAVADHLAACAECPEVLANYQKVTEGLLFALPPQPAPAGLRARLAEATRPKPEAAVPARPRFRLSLAWAAYALVVVALIVGIILQAAQIQALEAQESLLIKALQENQAEMAVAAQPGVTILKLESGPAAGNLIVSPDGKQAVFFLRGLAVLDGAHTYQMWLVPANAAPVSVGLFQAQAGQPYVSILVTSPTSMKTFAAFAISVEPQGGSPAPTTKPILAVNF
jgi:anti-sigma-K factor RskA